MPAILVAILLIVIILFMMCAFQVSFTETAVVTRFDEIKKVIEPGDAGLHFKLPWPVDRVHRYDTRLRTFDTEFRQLGTEDQKTVVMTAYATWRIDEAKSSSRRSVAKMPREGKFRTCWKTGYRPSCEHIRSATLSTWTRRK